MGAKTLEKQITRRCKGKTGSAVFQKSPYCQHLRFAKGVAVKSRFPLSSNVILEKPMLKFKSEIKVRAAEPSIFIENFNETIERDFQYVSGQAK